MPAPRRPSEPEARAPRLGEAAAVNGTSHQNVRQIARQLETRGFLEIRPDPDDARAVRLHPTPTLAVFDEPLERRRQRGFIAGVFAGLSGSEVEQLGRLLQRWANGLAASALYGFLSIGPPSDRHEFEALVDEQLTRPPIQGVVSEADLAYLPAPVARYVRSSGAVGQPRISNVRVRFRARMRFTTSSAWMPAQGEQYTRVGADPSRLFFMDATMKGLPVDVFHAFVGRAPALVHPPVGLSEVWGATRGRAKPPAHR